MIASYLGVVVRETRLHYFTRNCHPPNAERVYLGIGAEMLDEFIVINKDNDAKQTQFRAGNVRFYLWRNEYGAIELVITGSFPSIYEERGHFLFTEPSNCTGLKCLLSCYVIERGTNQKAGFPRDESCNFLDDMPRELCGSIGRFSGVQWAHIENTKLGKDIFLDLLFHCSDYQTEVFSQNSWVSSITSQSTIRRSIIVQEVDHHGQPIFNPLKSSRRGEINVTNVKFGRRVPTVFHAFLDGLVYVNKRDSDFTLNKMLFESRKAMMSVAGDSNGQFKVYDTVYIEGNKSSQSITALNTFVAIADSGTKVRFSELYMMEKLREGVVGEFQLAALCSFYNINVEMYHHSSPSTLKSGGNSVRSNGVSQFLRDESFPVIKILQSGFDMCTLYESMNLDDKYMPRPFYSLLQDGAEHRLFVEEKVFNPLNLPRVFDNVLPNVDIYSAVLPWQPSIFVSLSIALTERKITPIILNEESLLQSSLSSLFNILLRNDNNGNKVFDNIFSECCEQLTPEDETLCFNLISNCNGSLDAIKEDAPLRFLLAYLYVSQKLRSGCIGEYQLAALCLQFEVNIDLYILQTDNGSINRRVRDYYYGHKFSCIEIVQRVGTSGDIDFIHVPYVKAGIFDCP